MSTYKRTSRITPKSFEKHLPGTYHPHNGHGLSLYARIPDSIPGAKFTNRRPGKRLVWWETWNDRYWVPLADIREHMRKFGGFK